MSEDDAALGDVADLAEQLDQSDVAAAIESIEAEAETGNYDKEQPMEVDDVNMPFYEQQRELAFTLGLAAGAILEGEYGESADESGDDGE